MNKTKPPVSFTSQKFAYLLNKYDYKLNTGDIVAGTIISKENHGFLVDIGDQIVSYLPYEEISIKLQTKIKQNNLKILNLTREFFLLNYNFKDKQSILSIKRLEYIRGWQRIKQIQSEDILFELPIDKINKGGIITFLEGIQGFVPNSHILKNKQTKTFYKTIICTLLFCNDKNNQIIFSHKSALLYLSRHKFRIGEIVYGKIIKIQHYGLFIQINKILALLHISEIGFKYITNIKKLFHLGELLKVQIIHINIKQGRLSVSIRYIK